MYGSIHPAAIMGPVSLLVPDLGRSVRFYREKIGLELIRNGGEVAVLGVGARHIVQLDANPRALPAPRAAGLYHLAILLPSRRDLALALKRLREAGIRLQGSADHSVSQSLYLADPDGNGIELYCDRPRQQWTHEDGQLKMTVDPLDTTALLSEAAGESIPSLLPPGSSVGHVHLRVSYIDPSERFYCHTLGFELTARYGQAASFVAAGGYHHHIAFNVWHGVGVPAPPEGALGLRRFSIVLPSKQALEQLAQRLRDAGITFQKVDGSILLKDPSGIPLALTV